MGILEKLGRVSESQKVVQNLNTSAKFVNIESEKGLELTKEEYEFLFQLIKTSTFKGTELQIIFGILSKLQTKYLELNKTVPNSNK